MRSVTLTFRIPAEGFVDHELAAAGGAWVLDFGGRLSFLLPPNSIWDPTRELEAASEVSRRVARM